MLVTARRPLASHLDKPFRAALAAALVLTSLAQPAHAQRRVRAHFPRELRGSQESVQKMWDFATTHGLVFYRTPRDIDKAVAEGKLVPLDGDTTYELTRTVGFSYATREAKQFVASFAPQYLAACGAPLIVTSAARPTNRQPRNSNQYSVHPTGIAVDLRRPPAGPCQTWLRKALAELEDQGYIEATEERRPVHLHVAVLTEPGKIAALPPVGSDALGGVAPRTQRSDGDLGVRSPAPAIRVSNPPARRADGGGKSLSAGTYRVREGDTLWDVARRNGISVAALAKANRRSTRAVLKVGTLLRVPGE
jgi:nucleoid-associated protein YgaU